LPTISHHFLSLSRCYFVANFQSYTLSVIATALGKSFTSVAFGSTFVHGSTIHSKQWHSFKALAFVQSNGIRGKASHVPQEFSYFD
jgi:hypothetical protein